VNPEDLELLSAYECDELSGAARARAERLLRESPSAQEVVERLRALRGLLTTAAPPADPRARARAIEGVLAAARRRRQRNRLAATGALVALSGLFAAAVAMLWLGVRAPRPEAHRTGPGEHLALTLPGAAALLGEQSELEVIQEPARTRVRLHAGSGRFVVEHHPGHTFVVETPAADAVVHGTEFDVEVSHDGTDVRVIRGEVEVKNTLGSRRLWAHESARARPGAAPCMVERHEPVILHGPAELQPTP
jgi:ferric-dicitrate binding protein FerR (iron transport regulator)